MAPQVVRDEGRPLSGARPVGSGATWAVLGSLLALVNGCASHSDLTRPMRTALDEGRPAEAVAVLDAEMKVDEDKLPDDLQNDRALLVLDRASIQQARARYAQSERDFGAADKAIDVLDLSKNASDTIANYVYSGSSGRYAAPAYEKLLINALNMLNYLSTGDLNGAQVEARRLAVTEKYLRDSGTEKTSALFALGAVLAGVTFEKAGENDEALRYYDEALVAGLPPSAVAEAVARISPQASYKSPALTSAAALGRPAPAGGEEPAEVIIVVGYGRVPHKIAKRIPIGLALTYFAGALSPTNVAAANRLAAQGLVTWINYPTLGPEQGGYGSASLGLDGRDYNVPEAVDVSGQVRAEWHKIEGKIVASAITRMIARLAVGTGIQAVAGRNSIVGTLASLGTQATLTALDTPDTRSWETLPARVALLRVRLPPGRHSLLLRARGVEVRRDVELKPGGFAVLPLLALR